MTTLGSCLLSNDIPFEGMAKDIVQRRVQGQSWKQIGEELNIGSPGAARKMFTKLTGISDYKIKGNDLLKLVNEGPGIPEAPTIPKTTSKTAAKKAATEAKKVDIPQSVADGWEDYAKNKLFLLDPIEPIKSNLHKAILELDWKDLDAVEAFFTSEDWAKAIHLKPSNLKFWLEQKGVVQKAKAPLSKAAAPDVTESPDLFDWHAKPSAIPIDDVAASQRKLVLHYHKQGKTYLQIQSNLPSLSIEQIDRVVARYLTNLDTNPWEALKAKQTSLTLQKQLSDKVWDAVQKGISPTDITKKLGVPKSVIDDIVKADGKWSLPYGKKLPTVEPPAKPFPHSSTSKPPANTSMGSVDGGAGNVDTKMFPNATDAQLKAMRDRRWTTVKSAEERHYPEFYTRQYTGSAYHTINGALRRKAPGASTTSKQVKNMDAAMYEVDENFSVTRGMGREGFGLGHMTDEQIQGLVGKVVSDGGFLSTSTKPIFSNQVRLNVEVPKGSKGHWAKPISQHPGESEFILARGTRLQILGIHRQSGTYGGFIVRARVIP